MNITGLLDQIRTTGLIGMGVGAAAVLVLGVLLGVLIAARRSSGKSSDASGALDDTLAATGVATVSIRVRGERMAISQLSESIEALTGYTAEALCQGDAFLRMLDEIDASDLERKIVSAIREERATLADFAYVDADGRTRWMQLRAEPADRSRDGLRGVVREITESRQLNHDLAETRARFHALADATPAMLWVLDDRGQATAVNRATERFCGVTEAALLGEGWMLAIDEQHHDGLRQFIARVLDEGMSLNRDVVMIDPDNRERTISMTATIAKDSAGRVASVVLTGRDVTDRSESDKQRERLTRLIEASENPAVILSPDLRVAMLNPAARGLAGLSEGESAGSIALWHVVTQESVDRIRSEAARYCKDGGVFQMRGMVRDGADGSLAADLSIVGLGDDWLGVTATVVEQNLALEAEAEGDRHQMGVLETVLATLGTDGRHSAARMCAALAEALPGLRASFSIEISPGVLSCETSDEPDEMGSASTRRLTFSPDGSLLAALRRGETLTLGDVWAEDQLADALLELESTAARALAVCPVRVGMGRLGVLMLEHPEPTRWNESQLRTLRWASSLLTLALAAEHERSHGLSLQADKVETEQRLLEAARQADELAAIASGRQVDLGDAERRLARAEQTWSGALVRLAERVARAAELEAEARDAGQTGLAERLSTLAIEAERAEISGRLVTGTLELAPAAIDPREVLRAVGSRIVASARERGATLRISKEGELPDTFVTDRRLLAVACAELLSFAVERSVSREVRAVARPADDGTGIRLTVSVGRMLPQDAQDAPGTLRLLRDLAKTLGGTLETGTDSAGAAITLRVPELGAAEAGDTAEEPLDGIGDSPDLSQAA